MDNLKDAYPNAKTEKNVWKDLEEITGMARGTINKSISTLHRHHFIHELSIPQRKEVIAKNRIQIKGRPKKDTPYDSRFYIVEQSDSSINLLSGHKDPKKRVPKYILAPGYVEYDEKFSKAWDILLSKLQEEDTLWDLSKHIVQLLSTVLLIATENKETEEVAPSTDYASTICTNCGINHEARSFLRAVMLKLLDHIELSPEYRDFLKEKNILDNLGYGHYQDASEHNGSVLKSLLEKETSKEIRRQDYDSIETPVSMRIITMALQDTDWCFLAFTKDGWFVNGNIDNSLKPEDMKEGVLMEYTGPIKSILWRVNAIDLTISEGKGSVRILQQDNGSTAGQATIPLDSINDLKEDRKVYRVIAEIVDIKERDLGLHVKIKDRSSEIKTIIRPLELLSNLPELKLGDRIEVFGSLVLANEKLIYRLPPFDDRYIEAQSIRLLNR